MPMLAGMKRKVEVFIIDHSHSETKDFKANLVRLDTQNLAVVHSIGKVSDVILKQKENSLIIDALLGTGLNKPVAGFLAEVIDFINNSQIGLYYSCGITLICLFIFGYFKSKVTGQSPVSGAFKVVVIGTLAATAAFLVARMITEK